MTKSFAFLFPTIYQFAHRPKRIEIKLFRMLRKCVVAFRVLVAFDENIMWQAKIVKYLPLVLICSLSNHVPIAIFLFYL